MNSDEKTARKKRMTLQTNLSKNEFRRKSREKTHIWILRKYIKKWIPTKNREQNIYEFQKKRVKNINSDEKNEKKKELIELKELPKLIYKILIFARFLKF